MNGYFFVVPVTTESCAITVSGASTTFVAETVMPGSNSLGCRTNRIIAREPGR